MIMKLSKNSVVIFLFIFGLSHFSFAETYTPKTIPEPFLPKTFNSPHKDKELKCSGWGKKVCTSKYAYPCPKGWSTCPLTDGNKTCCKQDAKKKLNQFQYN